jgi:GH24 family phage-related lysozyme (muramidase)
MIRLSNLLNEASLAFDNEFKELVKQWEGPGPTDRNGNHLAYDDANPRVPAKPGTQPRGTLTIGYGTTAAVYPALKPGMKISKTQAEDLLVKGIEQHERKAIQLIPKFNTYPKYVRAAILNAIYRGDLGPNTRKLINQGKWKDASIEYLKHKNYTNPGKFTGVVKRMKSNADAFLKYSNEMHRDTKVVDHGKSIIGQTLYPRNRPSSNYVNVRTSPEVNTGLISNFQVKIEWPKPVGKVVREKVDDTGKIWFLIKLLPGVGNGTGYGWVRFDNVTTDKNAKYVR